MNIEFHEIGDNIDNKIKELYNTSNYPKDIFENVYNKIPNSKQTKKFSYYKLVASLVIFILMFSFGIVIFNINSKRIIAQQEKTNDEKIANAVNNEEQNSSQNIDSRYNKVKSIPQNAKILLASNTIEPIIQTFDNKAYTKSSVVENTDCIAIVKLNKILYGTNHSEKSNRFFWPVTISNYTIEKTFKGNLSGDIEIATDTDTILTITEYANSTWGKDDAINLGYTNMSEEERKNTFVKVESFYNYTTLNEGDYYISYIKYNEQEEMYGIFDYYFFEYDKENNTIRIPGTNNWENFELKDYENFIK